MALPTINYGDTFVATCVYQNASGAAVNLTTAGITPSAIISDPDGIATVGTGSVVVTLLDQVATPGGFTITSDSSTWDNVIGTWSLLIRYTNAAGIKWSAQRIEFYVI